MRHQVDKIIAWQPVLTDHQAFTYWELFRLSGLSVTAHVAHLEDEIRRVQGWADTRVSEIDRQVIPRKGFLRYGLRCLLENRDQIHVFGSPFENVRMILLLWIATKLGIRCYLISEPYSPVNFGYFSDEMFRRDRLKAFLRPYLYRLYILGLRGGLEGVFTISRLAYWQYANAGMPTRRLFPFGYFVPSEISKGIAQSNPKTSEFSRLRLVFVGSLISRKGLSTLIDACRLAIGRGADILLDVYGPGDFRRFDFDDDRICYRGRIAFGRTQQHLLKYDLMVMPSYYDGWGVVVNEALCAGIPVLCSDMVGACVLVKTFGAGQVFRAGDKCELADQIVEIAASPARLGAMKSACISAADVIQPARAAAYMQTIFSTDEDTRSQIHSPWYGEA